MQCQVQVARGRKGAQYKLTLKELEIYDPFDGRNCGSARFDQLPSLSGAAGEWFDTTGWLELPRG